MRWTTKETLLKFSSYFEGRVRGLKKHKNDGLEFIDPQIRSEVIATTTYEGMKLWISRRSDKATQSVRDDSDDDVDNQDTMKDDEDTTEKTVAQTHSDDTDDELWEGIDV